MNKQAIINKIDQELQVLDQTLLQEALDYTEEDLQDIELARKEIQEGNYITLEELERKAKC
ncbi:MAG: hypothetical protein HZA78_11535 [Candidatus Schekmanbacteria bacterium]|nr:hypothetical protein [Candidatus Schekmanbacteria bacterium]